MESGGNWRADRDLSLGVENKNHQDLTGEAGLSRIIFDYLLNSQIFGTLY